VNGALLVHYLAILHHLWNLIEFLLVSANDHDKGERSVLYEQSKKNEKEYEEWSHREWSGKDQLRSADVFSSITHMKANKKNNI